MIGLPVRHRLPRCVSSGLSFFMFLIALFCCFAAYQGPAGASLPSARDEAAEKRLAAISAELRCLVCQNESLAGSQADLAKDLRREILVMIEAGKSDGEILDFMVDRYGDFVRYRPPLKGVTLLLWFGPALLLLGGLGGLFVFLRRQNRRADEQALSDDEQRQAARLLAGEEDSQP